MAKQAERREATRARLVQAAIPHFVARGFDGTHTSDILKDAGVSRGAMYHHFPSKKALFEAVFVSVSEGAIDTARNAFPSDASPLEGLTTVCLAWLKAAREDTPARILLDLGPQVLGWHRARELEEERSLGLMKRALEHGVDAGEVETASIDLAARVINAAVAEIALAALHLDPAPTDAEQEAVLRQAINAYRRAP